MLVFLNSKNSYHMLSHNINNIDNNINKKQHEFQKK